MVIHLPIQTLLRYSIVVHAYYMTQPSLSSLFDDEVYFFVSPLRFVGLFCLTKIYRISVAETYDV